ncbi:MAG: hypothetical protein J5950_07830 [Clostridia bacterium]|nr:hypothetical protein [Clostridia bacterium]
MSKIDELKEIYDQYIIDSAEPQSRTIGDLFRGWFSGKGRGNTEADEKFMNSIELCVSELAADESGNEAFEALSLILSRPRGKKFNSRDLVFAAVHSYGERLVPLLDDSQAQELLIKAEEVPKPYRFPAYKQLVQSITEKAACAEKDPETADDIQK